MYQIRYTKAIHFVRSEQALQSGSVKFKIGVYAQYESLEELSKWADFFGARRAKSLHVYALEQHRHGAKFTLI